MSEHACSTGASATPAIAVVRRPLLGYLAAMVRNPLETVPPEAYDRPMVCLRAGGLLRVYVCDPALIHEALVRQADALGKGRVFRRVLGPALGNGLLTAEGADWTWQRQAAAPAFQHTRLLGFLPAMIAAAEDTRARWAALAPDAALDIGHEMMRTTFAIIVESMLSGPGTIDVVRVERSITGYLASTGWAAALAILGAPRWMPYPGRRRAFAAADVLRSSVRAMVAARRGRAVQRDDLVTLLLTASDPQTGRAMTDDEITDNLLTFITAGHETTAQGLAWTLQLLAAHPAVEAKMLAEIQTVTGGAPLRPDDIAALAYARQVFSEGMRLFPPAPMIVRRIERGFALGGMALAPGTMLMVPIVAVHRHRLLWDDPEAFDPERFAPERVKARHRYSYMPFGAGPRICIGNAFATMEAVAILAVLLRAFRVGRLDAKPPIPVMRITLRPRTPILMSVTPRARPA